MLLAEELGIMEPYVVGILEVFWHWVAKYHPHGEITGIRPTLMARAMRYTEDPKRLLDSLAVCGFLDHLPDGKVLVHDWSEHADNSVHQLLKKRHELFADGSKPFTRNKERLMTGSQTVHEPNVNGSTQPEPEPEPEPINTPPIACATQEESKTAMPASTGAKGEFAAAFWLQQEVRIAATSGDMQVLAQVVQFVAQDLSFNEPMEAAEWLAKEAKAAEARGQPVNLFWFKDGKYKQPNGGKSGKDQPSPAKQRIDGARRKLAEIAIKRGVAVPSGGNGCFDQAVPVTGSRGIDRSLPAGPGSPGPEVLPPERHPGSTRVAN